MTGRLGAGPDLADVIAERDQLRAQLAQAQAEAAARTERLERIRAVALEWQHQDCQRGDECDEAAWDADGETECAEHPDGDCPACSEECGRGLLLRLTDLRPGAGRALLDRLHEAEKRAGPDLPICTRCHTHKLGGITSLAEGVCVFCRHAEHALPCVRLCGRDAVPGTGHLCLECAAEDAELLSEARR